MMRLAASLIFAAAFLPVASTVFAQDRAVVDASAPEKLAVTVYRDPEREEGEEIDRDYPQGFAVISETRTVTLPAGRSTIRFDGVSEGMVAVSAIVTGLPGGTIEKNRNADLLSPASLVDGTLGNRVRITRTNPATGVEQSERAIVRTRADGGIVLQTASGFEAVRCAGLPEKLTFDRVPGGLSANPVFSIDTHDDTGGTYQVTLTYISWGFDWEAHYVATLKEAGVNGRVGLRLLSWLTVLNDNGQSFPDAELLAVAGSINVDSDFEDLAEPPTGAPLRLRCYPLGSSKTGSPVTRYEEYGAIPPPPPAPVMMEMDVDRIVVTGSRIQKSLFDSVAPIAVVAQEEQLGDLKLFRVPESMTVAAQAMKQVAFLNKDHVDADFLYELSCSPGRLFEEDMGVEDMFATGIVLAMKNEKKDGLGVALPMGGLTLFEPGPAGTQLIGELGMRDYAVGQDVELDIGESTMVFSECAAASREEDEEKPRRWTNMRAEISNANPAPVTARIILGSAGEWDVRWPRRKPELKDGLITMQVEIPANSRSAFTWKMRRPKGYYD